MCSGQQLTVTRVGVVKELGLNCMRASRVLIGGGFLEKSWMGVGNFENRRNSLGG